MAANQEQNRVRLVIHGAAGRMGRRLVALAQEDQQLKLVGALEAKGHPLLGQDAGALAGVDSCDVALSDQWPAASGGISGGGKWGGVMIDFSLPTALTRVLELSVDKGCALVIGTTGLSGADQKAIDDAAKKIAVLQAANMSLGVNLLLGVVAQIAKALGDDYDIEIAESHHRFKKDAPSGTALALAQAICTATGKSLDKDVVHGRQGHEALRKRGEIGMHALRIGDVVGEHTVYFGTPGERLEVTHVASNRDIFAKGALHAAKWLAGQKPGRYTMKDVLGLA